MYTPLIDWVPADHWKILTAVKEAMKVTGKSGHEYTIITFDQQLYKILINLIWVFPFQLGKLVARLGGMHLLKTRPGNKAKGEEKEKRLVLNT